MLCNFEGCQSKVRKNKKCFLHGDEKRCTNLEFHKNDAFVPPAMRDKSLCRVCAKFGKFGKCTFENCLNDVFQKKRCKEHLLSSIVQKKCNVKDCQKYAKKGGKCYKHRVKIECYLENCRNEVFRDKKCKVHFKNLEAKRRAKTQNVCINVELHKDEDFLPERCYYLNEFVQRDSRGILKKTSKWVQDENYCRLCYQQNYNQAQAEKISIMKILAMQKEGRELSDRQAKIISDNAKNTILGKEDVATENTSFNLTIDKNFQELPVNVIKQGKNGKKYYLDDSEPTSDEEEETETALTEEELKKLVMQSFPNKNLC